MRGFGSLQQLLGKRTGKKPLKEEEHKNKRQQHRKGRDNDGTNQKEQTQQPKLHHWFSSSSSKPGAGAADSSAAKQQAIISQAAVPAEPAYVVHTQVVGTRHHQASDQPAFSEQQNVQLLRQPSNPVDPCAIQVCCRLPSGSLCTYGHLPASVSAHLAGLLDAHAIEVAVQHNPTAAISCDSNDSSDTAVGLATRSGMEAAAAACSSCTASSSDTNPGSSCVAASCRQHAWQIKLAITLTAAGQQAGLREVAAAIDAAAAAGLESLEPGRNTGALLAASFDHILQQTRVHDLHLLDEQEQIMLQQIQSLPTTARALLLRLLLRKTRWFQAAALSYPDVPDAAAAAQQLTDAGLVWWSDTPGADLHSLLQALPVPALRAVQSALLPRNHPALPRNQSAAASTAASPSPKEALISSIQGVQRARLQAAICAAAGKWFSVLPAVADAFNRMQRLYFLSPGQDLNTFGAVDRGVLRYPVVSVRRTSAVFPNRQALLEYEQALDLAAQVEAQLEAGNNTAAWKLVQPALAALKAGTHKSICWDESHGPMPNPPASASGSTHAIHQQAVLQPWHEQRERVEQLVAAQQEIQLLDEQQEEQQPESPLPRQVSRSPSPRCPFSPGMMLVKGRSRSRTPSPSSNTPGSSSDDDTDDSHNSSTSHSRASASSSSLGSSIQGASSSTTSSTLPSPAAPAAVPAAGSVAGVVQPLFLARFCAGWVAASLGTVAVSLLEKQQRWGEAVELLRLLLGGNACLTRRGDWWSRLAINLEHQGLPEQALEAVETSLADSWVRGGDRLGLQRRQLRLGRPPRRWKRPAWARDAEWEPPELVITGRPLNCTAGAKSRFYGLDDSQVGVEQLALQHYASEAGGGWQGLHSEGGVWATLFGLLLWDELFMDVPDVFRSPFQMAPLDLDCDTFYPVRRERIDRQLCRIADGQAGKILCAAWKGHAGVMCRGVSWSRFELQQLLDICECVGGLGLAGVLRLMAEDHAGAQGGLPDLLLWRLGDRTAKVVEVKGPRDRLSNQQRFWLAHMAKMADMSDGKFKVEVCKVKEPCASVGSSRNQ